MNAVTPFAIASSAPPPGSRHVLWEGRPTWSSAALRVWNAPWTAAYFALLLADGARLALAGVHAPPGAWAGEVKLFAIAFVVVGGLLGMSALTVRTTRYTLDDRALTLRYGMALPATLVIPFTAIAHVGIRIHRDGTGDVAVRLKPGQRVIYPKLWPHARPWRFREPEPMLRCIPEPGVAAARLCRAIAARSA